MFNTSARPLFPLLAILFLVILACNMPMVQPPASPGPDTQSGDQLVAVETPTPAGPTSTPAVLHVVTPGAVLPGKLVYDVESESTAPEKRAPYGDSYNINRLERPFLQDMTYIADLDIVTYEVGSDATWWYVSIELIGVDPNNALGIHYGVELDLDHDGFGDYIVWASPPYAPEWETPNVQIFQDKNHNTGGLSGEKADAPIDTDGYETLIFNGGNGDADPDMAWVRTRGSPAHVEFAFKKSWAGTVFMLGVLSDAGLKDVGQLDYVDRFTETEAGSPIKDKVYYPLKALHSVDNACRAAFGFSPTGFEPQICPTEPPPTRQPKTPDAPTATPTVPIIF